MTRPCLIAGLILASSLLGGCATGSGARWYAPATWLSRAPADKADKAAAAVDKAGDAAVKQAQATAHETRIALLSAPPSRPVEVAVAANDNTVALLDQVAGPMTTADTAKLRAMVAGLLSENAAIRSASEKDRAQLKSSIDAVSGRLSAAVLDSGIANGKLRLAFERENALANELRTQRALAWIAGGAAILFLAGWVYLKFCLGGVPGAIGTVIGRLKQSHPDAADETRAILDDIFHNQPRLQAKIAAAVAKAA